MVHERRTAAASCRWMMSPAACACLVRPLFCWCTCSCPGAGRPRPPTGGRKRQQVTRPATDRCCFKIYLRERMTRGPRSTKGEYRKKIVRAKKPVCDGAAARRRNRPSRRPSAPMCASCVARQGGHGTSTEREVTERGLFCAFEVGAPSKRAPEMDTSVAPRGHPRRQHNSPVF